MFGVMCVLFVTAVSAARAIQEIDYSSQLLPDSVIHGGPGLAWEDRRGRNLVIWSEDDDIRITQYRIYNGRLYQVHRVRLPRPACEDGDQTFRLSGEVALSDADNDGIGEILFAVEEACITDLSAHDLTITLWEAGDTYRLYGQTVWWDGRQRGIVRPPIFEDAVSREPRLQQALENRFFGIIEAERLKNGSDATVERRGFPVSTP